MAPFWRSPFLVPLYGFGIALILTVGAGSVLASSSAALTEAQANIAASEERAAVAEQQRDDAERRATEAEARAAGAADGAGTGEPPATSPQLVVRVTTKDGERLDAPSEQAVLISYSAMPGGDENSLKLSADGEFAVARPQGEVTEVCVKQPDKWRVTPETGATPVRDNPSVACITPPRTPPEENLLVEFRMDPAS
jgi:hypothetical protein